MLVLLGTLACTDALLCPDGCNDEPQQHAGAPTSTGADCLTCRNAISTALPLFDLTPLGLAETTGPGLALRIPDSTSSSIDHPPRVA